MHWAEQVPPAGGLTDQLCQAELLADGAQLLAFAAATTSDGGP